MNFDGLAEQAVGALIQRLPDLAGAAADSVVGLVRDRLNASRSGTRALESLRGAPKGRAELRLVVDLVADELARDDRFAARVASALGGPSWMQASGVSLAPRSRVTGDVAGGNIDKSKKFHIGSIRFGGGGLTTLIILGVLASGAGGAALYTNVIEPNVPIIVDDDLPPTESGSSFASSLAGGGTDVDQVGRLGGDGIPDVAFRQPRSVETLTTARLATLPPNENPTLTRCRRALENPVSRVEDLDRGSIVCVQTSTGAIAAYVFSDVTVAGFQDLFNIEYRYWAADA